MVEETSAILVASGIRMVVSVSIFYLYTKNKNILAFYTFLFVSSFAFHGLFRQLALLSGDPIWFFFHRITLSFGPVFLLMGLSRIGIRWLSDLHIVPLFLGILLAVAHYDTYVAGGLAGEERIPVVHISAIILTLSLLLSAWYFWHLGRLLPRSGRTLLVLGILLQGVLSFFLPIIRLNNLTREAFIAGSVFFLFIASGWWLCVYEKSKRLK